MSMAETIRPSKRNNDDAAGNGVFGYTRVPDGAGVMGVSGAGGIGVSGASTSHGVMGKGGFGVTGRGSIIGVWGIGDERLGRSVQRPSAGERQRIFPARRDGDQPDRRMRPRRDAVDHVGRSRGDSEERHARIRPRCTRSTKAAATQRSSMGSVVVTGDVLLTRRRRLRRRLRRRRVGTERARHGDGAWRRRAARGMRARLRQARDRRRLRRRRLPARHRAGQASDEPGRRPIALMGKVFCKVDADQGGIEVGDLLTTSPTEGHAMRADHVAAAFGTVIGKAMQPLDQGRGLIAVLVALQ